MENFYNKDNIHDIIGLTALQEGMLFQYIQEKNTDEYFEQFIIKVHDIIDIDRFKSAWHKVVINNEALRSCFKWERVKQPVQIILKNFYPEIIIEDLKSEIENNIINEDLIIAKDRNNKFDLTKVPFRIHLIKIADDEEMMIIDYHHIIFDGSSNGIIIKEFFEFYNGEVLNNEECLNSEKLSLKSYYNYIVSRDKEQEKIFWSNYLSELDVRKISDNLSIENEYVRYNSIESVIDNNLITKLKRFSDQNNISFANIFYTAWAVLLGRYTYSDDVIFDSSVSTRNQNLGGINNTVGLFINTVPIRLKYNSQNSFLELLIKVKETNLELNDYNTSSITDIKQYANILSDSNISDTLVVIENYYYDKSIFDKNHIKPEVKVLEYTNYNLTLDILTSEDLKLKLTFNETFFQQEFIEKILKHYIAIINNILDFSEQKISDFKIIDECEEKAILKTGIGKKVSFDKMIGVCNYIEKWAELKPNKNAVVFEDKVLTYLELSKRVNSKANKLNSMGIEFGDKVVVMIKRSNDLLEFILAIWKIGAIYIPVDEKTPIERLNDIIEDSDAKILITEKRDININRCIISYCDEYNMSEDYNSNLDKKYDPSSVAYIIYTSGSTGKPKGVIVEHIGMMNHLYEKISCMNIDENTRISQNSSQCFDISIWQFISCLITGGTVYIYGDIIYDITKFIMKLSEDKINILEIVPSYLGTLLDNADMDSIKSTSLKYLVVTGEMLKTELVNRWFEYVKNIPIVNAYGPTEASDDITHYFIYDKINASIVPIGKTIQNLEIYIVAKDKMNLCPNNVVGEICVSGIGVGRGYVKRDQETKDHFRINHFSSAEENKRLYFTGDLGYWDNEGNLITIGRIDNQVKVNGFRIELDEIENAIVKFRNIRDAVVLVRKDDGNKTFLCAYICSDEEIDIDEMKTYLYTLLPKYMVPNHYIRMKEFPLLISGKIDKKSLLNIKITYDKTKKFPINEDELKLEKIWKTVLGIEDERIGIEDDFFEFGGDSLKLISLRALIQKEYKVDININDLFTKCTIKMQLNHIFSSKEKNEYDEIPVLEKAESYDLSYNQKRIWYIYSLNPESAAWNMYGRIQLHALNNENIEETTEKVLNILIDRHESLRTKIEIIEGIPKQVVSTNLKVDLLKFDISNEKEDNEKTRDEIYKEISFKPINLTSFPAYNMALVKIDEDNYDLIFSLHHIFSDGWSMEILKKEFYDIYRSIILKSPLLLPNNRIHYKDYAAWQNKKIQNIDVNSDIVKYWEKKLAEGYPAMNFITDKQSDEINVGGGYVSYINEDTKKKLYEIAKENKTTLFSVMFTTYSLFLGYITGQNEIACGIPAAGRYHADTQNIVGFFINPLPIKVNIDYSKTVIALMKDINDEIRLALEYQKLPLEVILDSLKKKMPDLKVFFDMLNQKVDEKNEVLPNYNSHHISWVQDAKYDLYLLITEYKNGIELFWNYRKALFSKETIEKYAEIYNQFLSNFY